jgi:hypothetical protein
MDKKKILYIFLRRGSTHQPDEPRIYTGFFLKSARTSNENKIPEEHIL